MNNATDRLNLAIDGILDKVTQTFKPSKAGVNLPPLKINISVASLIKEEIFNVMNNATDRLNESVDEIVLLEEAHTVAKPQKKKVSAKKR